jgi:hypothetical protein
MTRAGGLALLLSFGRSPGRFTGTRSGAVLTADP